MEQIAVKIEKCEEPKPGDAAQRCNDLQHYILEHYKEKKHDDL